MQLLAEAGVAAEQRVALAQLLGLSTAGAGVGPAAAAAGSGQQQLGVMIEPVFNYLQLFHPQLSAMLQQKAHQVMLAKQQQQQMLRLQQQQQQRAGMPGVAAPAAGAYRVQVMQPTGPAAAAAAAGGGGGMAQRGYGVVGAAVVRAKRRTGGKKKRDADFYGDSDEEYNVDDPSEYEPRLHR
jgi:hypothetical protein